MIRHVGRVVITEQELCKLLGFEGGRIGYVGWSEDWPNRISVTIWHPAMPVCEVGEAMLVVNALGEEVQ